MKKICVIFIIVYLIFSDILPVYATETSYPQIESESAILMDAKTGQVLFQKNMNEQLYPASITKIMTILLGLENGNLSDVITMSREAVYSITRGSSHIALDTGEQITLEQASMAAMLPSANDASNGIAEFVAGTIPKFVELMNQRAVQAGALNTHFANANGLCTEDHVTTAYDMAMITKAALMNETFRKIFGTLKYEIPPTNLQSETRYLWAEHKMLKNGRYEYDGVIGGKTGYTEKSQNTLVTVAQRGDRELIVVAIKSMGTGVYTDTKALLDYGFDEFEETQLIMPIASENNIVNSNGKLDAIQEVINQGIDLKTTRLLHKSLDINDIEIDYSAVDNSDAESAQVKMSMKLKNPSSLMYGDMGSIVLEKAASQDNPLLPKILHVLWVVIKVIISIVLVLFTLRWFMKLRRSIRKYSNLKSKGRRVTGFYYNKMDGK